MSLVAAGIYATAILLCCGATAVLIRAWTRRRYWHKGPSDLHYIACSAALLVSAGAGALAGSFLVLMVGWE